MSGPRRRPAVPPDLAWIAPGFAIGSKPYAHQRDAVVACGIRSVVTLEEPGDSEASDWRTRGVCFVALPTTDWIAIPLARFDAVLALIVQERAAGNGVLLHCLAGQNRTPTIAAAVLCHGSGATVEAALAAIRRVRLISAPTDEQEKSLRRWVDLRCRRGISPQAMPPTGRSSC